jgi:hypothetical protein
MSQINESYLTQLIRDLHQAENELFLSNGGKQYQDDKLIKLIQSKAKQISNIKYNAQKLKEIIDKIKYQIDNPKIKAVGI